MSNELIESADAVGMFCRLNINTKRDLPIRTSEMGVLIFIQKVDGEVTPTEISDFFNISKPSVTAIIKSLIRKKYLTKKQLKADKRSYYVSITSKGNALVQETFDEYFKLIELLQSEMTSTEFKQLIDLIQKSNKILQERL
jgi:DNA-binding MarR family transcriptional regulator